MVAILAKEKQLPCGAVFAWIQHIVALGTEAHRGGVRRLVHASNKEINLLNLGLVLSQVPCLVIKI